MEQVSTEIYNYFNSLSVFTDVMGDRIFPLIALEETDFPFSIYKIEQQRGLSKDADGFDVTLFAYFGPQNYKEAVAFNDAVRQQLDSSRYQYLDSSIDFIDENQSIVLVLTFKKE
ncbi:MAG: hypothetical protein CMP76_17245 [Flavobacterium sp.]|uniref:hypothetical protein n=1 Tax=Flavobacterium sp. TaxID=239 RepID=UPI000C5E8783|nr:hypothetical protein [Flavobacterium sp.]MBF05025.1 hypothetical protein [Flavobacterium sp.]|tara:strand:+ start:681 stop:1025 length:345 start_codon:yes stop_codon:yes gene_type:complete